MREEITGKVKDIITFQRNVLFFVCVASIFLVFSLTIILLRKDAMVVLIPNSIDKETSISRKRPSNEYIEAITRDIIYSFLNITPDNINYSQKAILSVTHSSFHGEMKRQLKEIEEVILLKKFTTTFYPTYIETNNKDLTAIISGVLYTYLGQKEVGKIKKQYEIKYNYDSFRLTVIGFTEIKLEDKKNND